MIWTGERHKNVPGPGEGNKSFIEAVTCKKSVLKVGERDKVC